MDVLKRKWRADNGLLDKLKVRAVLSGNLFVRGVHCATNTFAPCVSALSVRLFLAICAATFTVPSSLDVETERSVIKALKKLSEGRTTLTIAHRLSTIVDSDEILVMIDGQISEKGSHVSLMEQDGWYAKMFRMQQDEVDTL